MPSPLKSATAKLVGVPAELYVEALVGKVPSPLPKYVSMNAPSPAKASTRSVMPSPLKSPAAIAGGDEAEFAVLLEIAPVPLPSRMLNPVVVETARSALPSPLKSPAMIVFGVLPESELVETEPKPDSGSGFTVCVTTPEVPGATIRLPRYSAVSLWMPVPSSFVDSVAVVPERSSVASGVTPSKNVTLSPVVPFVTVAVSVRFVTP